MEMVAECGKTADAARPLATALCINVPITGKVHGITNQENFSRQAGM
jgi:glycerol-3-phosphate dehydrogenase